MNEKANAVEISFLELQISSTADLEFKSWLSGLLERFRAFARDPGVARGSL